MSSTDTSGFGKFVPGFDFLQNLAKGASGGAATTGLPNLSQWLVPSLNVEDLEKRIEELKHVQFWLEQNSRALTATIQALEVQKMTMATLKGMNFTMGMPAAPAKAEPTPAPEPAPAPTQASASPAQDKPASGVVDPLQLWGSLTQQFQSIAANAFKEVSEKVAAAPGAVKRAAKASARTKAPAKKAATKKATAKKTPARAGAAPARRRGT